jgi:hypothetical protein
LVISVAQHERTPVCPLKTSNAPLAIFVLPIDLLSFVLVEGVLTEFLKNPVAPVVAPPGLSKHEPAIDRSSRDEDSPQMPCLSPGRGRTQVRQLIIIAASNRARTLSKNKAARRMIARWSLFRTAAHLISTSLDRARGTSAGGSRKNPIAFGTLPLWTSTRVNDGSFCPS